MGLAGAGCSMEEDTTNLCMGKEGEGGRRGGRGRGGRGEGDGEGQRRNIRGG